MTMSKKDAAAIGLTAAAAVVGTHAAAAADQAPVEEYVHDWSGVYVGAAAGMIFGGDFPIDDPEEYDAEEDFIYGGFIGVNHQLRDSNLVIGGEVAIQSGFDGEGDNTDNDYEVNYIVDGKLKLGYAMDDFMLYVFGGGSYIDSGIDGGGAGDYDAGGVNYGIGADWMVADHFSLGAELMGRTAISPYSDDEGKEDKTHWQGMLRAAFHFN